MSWKQDPVFWFLITLELQVLISAGAFLLWGVGGSFLALGLFFLLAVLTRPLNSPGGSNS